MFFAVLKIITSQLKKIVIYQTELYLQQFQ